MNTQIEERPAHDEIGTEYAAPLAVCDESNGRLTPLRFGYFRMHTDSAGEVFLAFAPHTGDVEPLAVKLHMDMTLREAIEAIGPDGESILKWAFATE